MSRWINKDLFSEFQKQKKEEKDKPTTGGVNRGAMVWKTPEKGTTENAKVYEGRFLPDKKGNFYKEFHYHMFQSGEKWFFTLCPKTFGFEEFCPFCTATSKLYMGTAADKKQAYNYKRKQKYVGNFYIVDDPRDAEAEEDKKVAGFVRLYEFPAKVEAKLREEITDSRNGLGPAIFDPSSDGYNFILKVLSTKRDPQGRVWPDYSNSTFSRRSSSLGTDSEIEQIMNSVIDLDEYIKGMERKEEDIIQVLKAEMLWDLIKIEWEKAKGKSSTTEQSVGDDVDDSVWDKPEETNNSEDSSGDGEWEGEKEGSEDYSDSDLLDELENL